MDKKIVHSADQKYMRRHKNLVEEEMDDSFIKRPAKVINQTINNEVGANQLYSAT